MFKNLLALSFGSLISFFILEVGLQIFNPIPFTIEGGEVKLLTNRTFRFTTDKPGLAKAGSHTKNGLGFRGPSLPKDFQNHLSIITVGGSTTECYYQMDGKDWPSLLHQRLKKQFSNVWLNNAGLGGHSLYGHQKLLDGHLKKIKPNYLLYLIGVNDIGRKDLTPTENELFKRKTPLWKQWLQRSQVLNMVVNFFRAFKARHYHGYPEFKEWNHLYLEDAIIQAELKSIQPDLTLFKARLKHIIESTLAYGIEPILITQPLIFGDKIDELTGTNLGTMEWKDWNGKLTWQVMQLYNEITKEFAMEYDLLLVDAAEKMPKSTLYFYDFMHYTDVGCEKMAEIIAKDLIPYLSKKN